MYRMDNITEQEIFFLPKDAQCFLIFLLIVKFELLTDLLSEMS